MEQKLSVWGKIKAYKLKNNVVILWILILIFIASFIVYLTPTSRNNEIVSNIAMAFFTSLLASIFAMIAEIYVKYKSNENDKFLEDIHTFGIANLNRNKEDVLRELLQTCDTDLWISGYRLIMTNNLKMDMASAVKRKANVKGLICPPWTEAFKLVYGEHEKVMDNYFEVFNAIDEANEDDINYEIKFVNKPLFSDTYKVDGNLVTGPYLHNKDRRYGRTMAKDFFSYNLMKRSRLYELIEGEYNTLFDEALWILNWERFRDAYGQFKNGDLRETEKCELMKNACDEISVDGEDGV